MVLRLISDESPISGGGARDAHLRLPRGDCGAGFANGLPKVAGRSVTIGDFKALDAEIQAGERLSLRSSA
jgi:hypothetical protein